jgi:hypothetical protein
MQTESKIASYTDSIHLRVRDGTFHDEKQTKKFFLFFFLLLPHARVPSSQFIWFFPPLPSWESICIDL